MSDRDVVMLYLGAAIACAAFVLVSLYMHWRDDQGGEGWKNETPPIKPIRPREQYNVPVPKFDFKPIPAEFIS